MCRRYSIAVEGEKLQRYSAARLTFPYVPRYNAAPSQWPYYLRALRFIDVQEGISWLGCEELEECALQLARHILTFLDESWLF